MTHITKTVMLLIAAVISYLGMVMVLQNTSAIADASSSSRIAITGIVPSHCTIKTLGAIQNSPPASIIIRNVKEFCNTPHGYRVYAVHSSPVKSIQYGGRSIPPSSSGRTIIYDSSIPGRRTKNLVITFNKPPGFSQSITLEISPK